MVAVKMSVCGYTTFDAESFVKAMIFACKVRHMNIISLVGCCLDTEPPLLVYEFAPRGCLDKLLHFYNGNDFLSLDLRLGIAIGSAQALEVLHSSRKIHGNFTSTCILLDQNLVPKVSDIFAGLLMSFSGRGWLECSNIAHLDPVYMTTGSFTSKSDIYSFGIVLLELITRKQLRNVDQIESIKACSCRNENSGEAMFDEEIAVEWNIFILEEVGKLAVDCLRENVDERPDMVEVVERLQKLRRDLNHGKEVLQNATTSHAD